MSALAWVQSSRIHNVEMTGDGDLDRQRFWITVLGPRAGGGRRGPGTVNTNPGILLSKYLCAMPFPESKIHMENFIYPKLAAGQ